MAGWDSAKSWRHLRLEIVASKHYWRSNLLYGMARPNALVDRLLPGLLYIKAVALLDEAFEQWLDSSGHKLEKPYRDDLNGRLEYLADKKLLPDVKLLHTIRQMRNTLAHETRASCTWDELERDASTIEAALLLLKLAVPTKALDFFYERSRLQPSEEPDIAFTRKLTYGVKEAGEIALEVSWTDSIHKFGAS